MSHTTSPGGGPPPQGPKISTNTGLIVLVVVAVVAALGGLVLLLGDDSGTSEPGGGSGVQSGGSQAETGQETASGGDIDEFADTLAAAIDQQDVDTLDDLSCAGAEEAVAAAIDMLDEVDAASTLPGEEAEPGMYLVALGLVMDGDARPYEVTVVEQDGGFCVQDIAEDSYAGAGVPDEGAFSTGAAIAGRRN